MHSALLNSNGQDNVNIDGISSSPSRKRKRSRDTVESVKFMKRIDAKLSSLHDMILVNSNLAPAPKSIASKDGITTSQDDQYGNNHRSKKKKKLLREQADVPQIGNKAIKVHGFVKDCTPQAFSNVNQFSDNSWKWTCSNTIPRLLQMLESSASEEFTTAVLVLLGQLGRLGDHNSGEQIGVGEDLRGILSSFLDQNSKRIWGLPTQFAAVHALIGLLSMEFEDIIQGKEHPASHYSDVVRKWFSHLCEIGI
ncbi:hypothetical protein MKW94_026309 [Papaver nudicaule]|uniref:Uncharacterized protein n=1 Tax=Papaver nudicaule TaxID=74823 RepID=A0AA41S989_PAPNU|nr:hypothetical protein [Papaver nudicaule]